MPDLKLNIDDKFDQSLSDLVKPMTKPKRRRMSFSGQWQHTSICEPAFPKDPKFKLLTHRET